MLKNNLNYIRRMLCFSMDLCFFLLLEKYSCCIVLKRNLYIQLNHINFKYRLSTAAMEQWVRVLAPHAEGWVLQSQPRQT